MNIKSFNPGFGSAFINLFVDYAKNKNEYACSWEITNDKKGDIFYNFSKIAESEKIMDVSTKSDLGNIEKLRSLLLAINEIEEPAKNTNNSRGREKIIEQFFVKKDLILNELVAQFNRMRFPDNKNE